MADVNDGQVSGPSYSLPLKVLATLVAAASAGLFVVLSLDPARPLPPAFTGLGILALLVVLAGWWDVLKSRTSIDDRVIRQAGLWSREVQRANITGVQLVHFRGLAWLVAPRLIVRSGGFGVKTFYACDPGVLKAFEQMIARAAR